MRLCTALVCSLLAPCLAFAQHDPQHPPFSGVITTLGSPGSFSLNGTPVELSPKAVFIRHESNRFTTLEQPPALFLGEHLDIEGQQKKKSFVAERVEVPVPVSTPVSGAGLIDRLFNTDTPSPNHAPTTRMVRADGYLLLIPPGVLDPATPLATNLLISYHGQLQPDGAVAVDAAELHTLTVSPTEDTLRDRTTYDQDTINAAQGSTPQSRFSRSVKGLDLDRLPLTDDPALQARVERIGRSLLPPAQTSLAPTDPNFLAINFRVVDAPHDLHVPIPLPSGTVLLPAEAIQRLQDNHPTEAQLDSQIASALAVGISDIREKHLVKAVQLDHKLLGATLSGDAIGLLIPGVGLAASLGAYSAAQHAAHLRTEQDNRISLALLFDAGYDLTQAPIASALLDSPKPQPFQNVKLTSDTLDLFVDLGRLYCPSCLNSTLPPAPQNPPVPPPPPGSHPAPPAP